MRNILNLVTEMDVDNLTDETRVETTIKVEGCDSYETAVKVKSCLTYYGEILSEITTFKVKCKQLLL